MLGYPSGSELFGYLSGMREPLRTSDFVAHTASVGLGAFKPDIAAFLGAQITVRDRHVGTMNPTYILTVSGVGYRAADP